MEGVGEYRGAQIWRWVRGGEGEGEGRVRASKWYLVER
jgi:hypothetical protein